MATIAGASWLAAGAAHAAALDPYVGKDPFEKVGGRSMYQLPIIKKDFVAKFGESRWQTLLGYETSQPIAAVDDAWLGRVIVTWQCKPHDCTNQAALVLRPAGDVVGVCFAGDHVTQWLGIGWQISAAESNCSSEAADIVARYKAAAAHAGH
jgi:hypothetical protein